MRFKSSERTHPRGSEPRSPAGGARPGLTGGDTGHYTMDDLMFLKASITFTNATKFLAVYEMTQFRRLNWGTPQQDHATFLANEKRCITAVLYPLLCET